MCAKFWAPLPPVTEKPVLADTLTNFFQLILDAYKNFNNATKKGKSTKPYKNENLKLHLRDLNKFDIFSFTLYRVIQITSKFTLSFNNHFFCGIFKFTSYYYLFINLFINAYH